MHSSDTAAVDSRRGRVVAPVAESRSLGDELGPLSMSSSVADNKASLTYA